MRIALAPNAFKGRMTALQAERVMAEAVRAVDPDAETVALPIADGGDGSLAMLQANGAGSIRALELGNGLSIPFLALKNGGAVLEVATLVGLHQLSAIPLAQRTTARVGLALASLIDQGYRDISICLGGSGTCDYGLGMIGALGGTCAVRGMECPLGVDSVREADQLNLERVRVKLEGVSVHGLYDAAAPLVGPWGAAQLYAPQKGADPYLVSRLESCGKKLLSLLYSGEEDSSSQPGDGAAGGLGFAIRAMLGGDLIPGASALFDLTSLEARLAGVDILLTGEGRTDRQTLQGKGPATIVQRARSLGIRCFLVSGSIDLSDRELAGRGLSGWERTGRSGRKPASPAEAAADLKVATAALLRRIREKDR